MRETLGPHPASACNSLHFGIGIEENQSLDPDLFPAAARGMRAGGSRRGIPAIQGAGRPASPIRSGACPTSERCA